MKKLIIGIVLAILLAWMPAQAQQGWKYSGSKSADALIWVGPGTFGGIAIATDGTNAVTVSIYDVATATTGALIVPTFVVPTSSVDRVRSFFWPIHFENGIYVDVTCAGTVGYEIYFQ
jgi:hypothetical protein